MKKLVTLLLAAGLVFSAANSASAVEVKVSGQWDFAFQKHQNLDTPFLDRADGIYNWGYDGDQDGGQHQKYGAAMQRIRLGMDFIMSESLSAHYQAQIGQFT